MRRIAFPFSLALLLLVSVPSLEGQTGTARGTSADSRVDFSFPAQLGVGKYAVIPLPDGLFPVRLVDDGSVIFQQFGPQGDGIGYRWKAGRLQPLRLPADLSSGGFMPFPFAYQATSSGWVMASFIRMPGPPSTAIMVWGPGESMPIRLKAPRFQVEGFGLGELVLEPVLNSQGKVWAKVVYPSASSDELVVKFVVWDSPAEEPRVLDEHGWSVTVAGVNAAGTLIGSYAPDPDDLGATHAFVGDFSRTVDFEPRLINDEGWVVGFRENSPQENILWKDGVEVPLPAGEIEALDEHNNLHGRTPADKQVMWTTDLNRRVSSPGEAAYMPVDYAPPLLPDDWASDVRVIPGDRSVRLGEATRRNSSEPQTSGNPRPALLIPAELAVDLSRDGAIKLAAEDLADVTSISAPLRFWTNDDDDSGDTGGSDIPDPMGSRANYRDQTVNGTRDLIDFFPVFLDIGPLLTELPADASITYKLRQADAALNFVYTNLQRDRALAYQKELLATGFGPRFTQAPGGAATQQITGAGVELSSEFLAMAKAGGGVILVEGRMPTASPLVLAIEQDGVTVAELKLELLLSGVEAMFRHVDLTRVPTEYDGSPSIPPVPAPPSRTADPGEPWPDRLTNGKYFVFTHGYNVDGQRARGWHAEVFKRLHVLGSNARFVGVTWNGATGVKIGDDYLDYHKAVFHAFQTGDKLAEALSFTNGAEVTVAAHSLGNVVVSQAIQSGGFTPARYFMINAAVPVEAYSPGDVSEVERTDMVEHHWKTYNSRLTMANWFSLFGSSDHRSELTWENRFHDVVPRIYDFFSPGDDVVSNAVGVDSASVSALLFRQGLDFSTGVWKAQELVKGVNWTTSGVALLMDRGQAGWGFNPAWYLVRGQTNSGPITSRRFSSEAGEYSVSTDSLKTQPFFQPLLEATLFDVNATAASAKAGEKKVQYDALARGIPSKSYAVATHKINSLDQTSRNFDMEAFGRVENQWPSEAHTREGARGRWLHSDFKNVALPYVHQMFKEMIARGTLK